MARYVLHRVLYMIPTLLLISVVSFMVIQLPPGNYLTTVVANLQQQGQSVDPAQLAALKQRYGLGQSVFEQYWKWISGIVFHLDFGQSFQYRKPVSTLLGERLPLTLALTVAALLVSWGLALPAGVYAAVKQYSLGDYLMTSISFLGLAIPGFLILLVLMYLEFRYFNWSVGGLFSPNWADAAWNAGKVVDLLKHMLVPIIVLGLEGTAGTIRILRANLLDELHKPYVVTARSRGLGERRLILRYPVRVALNPFFSTVGWVLPALFGGEVIIAQVAGLNTTGPMMLKALEGQDMYLAGSVILIISTLTVIGTLVSDLILAAVDPRIRERYV